jgi:predicted aconitase
MDLTREQERMRDEGTEAERKAMDLLATLGDVYGADRLIPVTSVHVAGASYKTVGDAGLEFLEDFARSARVRVRTTINPVGMDLARWRELGVPEAFAQKQQRIVRAYQRMGVEPTYSCTPYLVGNRPQFGEHVAWAESSAVAFANSVLGARTNREGGPSALASAVTGLTPDHGLHRDEHRKATVVVDVKTKVRGHGFSLLGLHVGDRIGEGVPFFRGLRGTEHDLKWLGASLASTSACSMFHVEGVTPEAGDAVAEEIEHVVVTEADLQETERRWTTGTKPDIIGLGTPQLAPEELDAIAALLERHRPRIPVWVFTSRAARDAAPEAVAAIERRGGKVLVDTCLEVTPMELFSKTVATPSGKAAIYLPTLCGQRVILEDIEALLERVA